MAKHDKLTLSISKADRTTDFPVLKYSSTERGKVVDVTVKDIDGTPYDLSGFNLEFVEELYNGNIIVDDGSQDNGGSFAKSDLKNGKFSYQFQNDVYQYDGWAHFKFKQNGNLIDTTEGFAIKIIDDIDDELDEKSYVVYFENIKKEHQTALNSLRELISSAQSLNDANHSEISVIKGNITDLSNRLDDQVDSLGRRITDVNDALSGRIDTLNSEKNTLNGRVDTLNDEKNALSGRVDSLNNEKEQLKSKNDEQDRQISSLNTEKEQLNQKVNSLITDKNNLVTEINNAKNANAELKSRVQTLENKQFIAHVAHESDVASQSAPIVIVDD